MPKLTDPVLISSVRITISTDETVLVLSILYLTDLKYPSLFKALTDSVSFERLNESPSTKDNSLLITKSNGSVEL